MLSRNLGSSEQRWLIHSQLWQPTSTKVCFHSLGIQNVFLRIMDYCIYHPPTQRIYFGQVTFPCIDLFFFFFLTILPDIPKKRGKQKLHLQLKFMIRYIRKVKGLWVHLQRKVKAFKGTCLEAHQNNIHPFIEEPSQQEALGISISNSSLDMVLAQPGLQLAVCELQKTLSQTVVIAGSKIF